jgi:3D (Asp-Asp-Asp) domain-containing protein
LRASRLLAAAFVASVLVTPIASADEGTVDWESSEAFIATVTAYANGADGGAVGSTTATGTTTHWGTVAADWSLFPPGTQLAIEGFDDVVFMVEDTGSGVHGLLIDIWFPDLETAIAFGMQKRLVRVLAPST